MTPARSGSAEVGIVLPNSGVAAGYVTADTLVSLAALADSTDVWDYVWVGDSLISVPRLESVVLLSACAARTKRVRLGAACQASLGLREPVLATLQWASLDVLSKGRMTLVACTGPSRGDGAARERSVFRLHHAERVRRMEACVELIRQASSEGALLTSVGDHPELVPISPGFVQRPFPVWITANPSPTAAHAVVTRGLERVAALGDGWMTFAVPPAVLSERIRMLGVMLSARDRQLDRGFPICVYVDVNVSENEPQAMDDAVATCRLEGRRNATAESLNQTAAVGSVSRCVEFLAPLFEAGATSLALRPVSRDPVRQMEALTAELVPSLRAALSGRTTSARGDEGRDHLAPQAPPATASS